MTTSALNSGVNLLRFAIGKLLSIRLIFYHNIGLGSGPNFRGQYITFDYIPLREASPGSANVTFAVVGAQLVTPTQQGVQALFQVPVPLFEDFASTMTKDFMEAS